ncbi:MAG: aldo/keto reductase [Spirochaetota bacterium]
MNDVLLTSEALGTWALSDETYWGRQDPSASRDTVTAAIQAGIFHFDTAQAYGKGKAEQLLGQVLSSYPRDKVFIASKIHTFEAAAVRKKIKTSLQRLKTPYLDLVYLHWPKDTDSVQHVYEALQMATEEGLVRHLGVSNFTLPILEAAARVSTISVCQFAYSLLWRYSEQDLIPYCRHNGIRTAAYSPLGQGLLAGRTPVELQAAGRRGKLQFFHPQLQPTVSKLLAGLSQYAEELQCLPHQLALAWIRESAYIDTIILGARNPEQLRENLGYREVHIPSRIYRDLSDLSDPASAPPQPSDNIFGHRWRS